MCSKESSTDAPGDVIIEAVIKAKAIDDAVVENDNVIFVWSANAAEQIEAAIEELGYMLVKKN